MRLEHKIVLTTITAFTLSFVVLAWVDLDRETEAVMRLHGQSSDLAVGAMVAGIRSTMLSGEGTYARQIIDEIRRDEARDIATLKLYGRDGIEVYRYVDFRRHIAPQVDSVAQAFIEAMRSGQDRPGPVDRAVEGQGAQVRMVALRVDSVQDRIAAISVAFELDPLLGMVGEDLYAEAIRIPGQAIVEGYRTIMVAGQAAHLATYADRVRKLPGLVSVQVFDNEGNKTKFGDTNLPLDQELFFYLSEALGNTSVGYTERADPTIYTRLFPLENEPRCYPCHGRDHRVRGVMRLSIRTADLDRRERVLGFAGDIAQAAIATTVQSVVEFGGKDVFVRDYVRSLEGLPGVSGLSLYSPEARRISLDDLPSMQSMHGEAIPQVLRDATPVRLIEDRGEMGRYLTDYVPLRNAPECWHCHANDHAVRAVIEITRSIADVDRQRHDALVFAIVVGVLTIIVVWLALYLVMRYGLVRPVNETAAGLPGACRPEPMGEAAVALVSSIRGLAALGEQVEKALAVYLRAQAKIVNAHGGRIERSTGEHLVAVFLDDQGRERAAHRAIACARQIRRIFHRVRETGTAPSVDIGIGINVGPVTEDTVRAGVLLCSVARPGQIVVSEGLYRLLCHDARYEHAFTPLPPVEAEGSAEPVPLYEVADNVDNGSAGSKPV